MKDYQQRVVDEKAELDVKAEKLDNFINDAGIFSELSDIEQMALITQRYLMSEYSRVLSGRIKRFE